jgi:hypothetical protein
MYRPRVVHVIYHMYRLIVVYTSRVSNVRYIEKLVQGHKDNQPLKAMDTRYINDTYCGYIHFDKLSLDVKSTSVRSIPMFRSEELNFNKISSLIARFCGTLVNCCQEEDKFVMHFYRCVDEDKVLEYTLDQLIPSVKSDAEPLPFEDLKANLNLIPYIFYDPSYNDLFSRLTSLDIKCNPNVDFKVYTNHFNTLDLSDEDLNKYKIYCEIREMYHKPNWFLCKYYTDDPEETIDDQFDQARNNYTQHIPNLVYADSIWRKLWAYIIIVNPDLVPHPLPDDKLDHLNRIDLPLLDEPYERCHHNTYYSTCDDRMKARHPPHVDMQLYVYTALREVSMISGPAYLSWLFYELHF